MVLTCFRSNIIITKPDVFYHVTLSIRPPEINIIFFLLFNKHIAMFFNTTEGFVEGQVTVYRLIRMF